MTADPPRPDLPQWPGLLEGLRQNPQGAQPLYDTLVVDAFRRLDSSAIEALLDLRFHFTAPPHLLEAISDYCVQNQEAPSHWDGNLKNTLIEWIVETPQDLSWDFWRRMLDVGGWNHWRLVPFDEALEQVSWYAEKRAQWMSTDPQAQELAIYSLTCRGKANWFDWSQLLEDCWAALPLDQREGFARDLSEETLRSADTPITIKTSLYGFLQSRVPLHGSGTWQAWWAQCFRADPRMNLENTIHPIFTAYRCDPNNPPPGAVWTVEEAFRWGKGLAVHLNSLAPCQGVYPAHEKALSTIMDLDSHTRAWGLGTSETQQALRRGLSAVCPQWETLLLTGTASLRASPRYLERVAQWKATQLDADWPNATPSPKPRF